MIYIGTPHAKNAGYYVNDKDLRTRQEDNIQTCAHCGQIVYLSKWKEVGGFCMVEMKTLCGPCATRAQTHGCEPMMKKIEQFAEAQMRYQQISRIVGLEPEPPKSIITGA